MPGDIEEREAQQPRHLVVVEFEGDDVTTSLICPFGNSYHASLFPTLTHDPWSYNDDPLVPGIPREHGWPQIIGQLEDGYCTMDHPVRPLFHFARHGAVLEVCHVASGQCRVEYEAEQIGLDDLLDDNLILYTEGVYPVIFWEDGWGEDYASGLQIEVDKRAPLPGH